MHPHSKTQTWHWNTGLSNFKKLLKCFVNTTVVSPHTCLLADQTINSDSKFQICFSWTDNFFWLLYLRLCKHGPHLPFCPLEGGGFWELREICITTSKCRKKHFHKQESIREYLSRTINQKLLTTVWTKELYFFLIPINIILKVFLHTQACFLRW